MVVPVGIKMWICTSSHHIEEWIENQLKEIVHFQEACQFTYIAFGSGNFLVDPHSYRFLHGEVYLFDSDLPHRLIGDDGVLNNTGSTDLMFPPLETLFGIMRF